MAENGKTLRAMPREWMEQNDPDPDKAAEVILLQLDVDQLRELAEILRDLWRVAS